VKKLLLALLALGSLAVAAPASAAPANQTVVITPADLATTSAQATAAAQPWFFYNDQTGAIDAALGTIVTGPATPPAGVASARITVTGDQRRALATYRFAGTQLATITTLAYSTYNPTAGNGGASNRAASLQINVDFNNTDVAQGRLLFFPRDNGTVVQNQWQEWNATANGNAIWRYSGANWPGTAIAGSTPRTWSDILATYPGIRVRVTDAWLGLTVGEPYADGYTENIDRVRFGTAAGITTFDFELVKLAETVKPPVQGGKGGTKLIALQRCMKGGWQDLRRADNSTFKNQGMCIRYANTGR